MCKAEAGCCLCAQLACARIGAVHSVVFAGFSADSLAGRILDSRPSIVLTASAVKRGAKPINLKAGPAPCPAGRRSLRARHQSYHTRIRSRRSCNFA